MNADLLAHIRKKQENAAKNNDTPTSASSNNKNDMLAQLMAKKQSSSAPSASTSIEKKSLGAQTQPSSTCSSIDFQKKSFYHDPTKNSFLFAAHYSKDVLLHQPTLLPETKTIQIPLAQCVYRMVDYTYSKKEPIPLLKCVLKLGVLRCLDRECHILNDTLLQTNATLEEEELGQTRFMELLSNCGVYQKVSELILTHFEKGIQVHIPHLKEFLQTIEDQTPSLKQARQEIETTASVSFFPGLGELFTPGSKLSCHPEGMEGTPLGCSVVQCWYDEEINRATQKLKRKFILVIEFVVSVGDELVFVAASEVYTEFHDNRNTPIKDLQHVKIMKQNDALIQRMQVRGEFYASVATKNHYLEYHPNSFFPIMNSASSGWSKNAIRPLSKGGRVMVDVKRGILEGHIPIRGSADGMSDTVKEAIKLFEQSKRTGVAVPFRTCALQQKGHGDWLALWQTWPMLTGFSFTARVWGKLLLTLPKENATDITNAKEDIANRENIVKWGVEVGALGGMGKCGNCGYIKFQERAFDQLVLADDKKELIRAVARNAGLGDGDDDDDDDHDIGIDVVANKGGASIFLLHGPPGCGKTLTAEAIAELLRKPLYVVTAGDLGITAAEVEKTLGSVLELCQTWDALVLIDEADVFLEARNSHEIQRNALVCVMLRLLEYYSGCLFLSSNRSASSIDAAIASRITVMLGYPPLDVEGRCKVWRNLIELVPTVPLENLSISAKKKSKYRESFQDDDYYSLAKGFNLNGRQIKNSIVLARALARERCLPLSLSILKRAVTAVAGEDAIIE